MPVILTRPRTETFRSKLDYHNYENFKLYDPRGGDTLRVEAEWKIQGLSPWIKIAKYKAPIFGVRYTPSNTGWGCRKPTPDRPGFTLRWVLISKKSGYYLLPYIYARRSPNLGKPKRCGNKYALPDWKKMKIREGKWFDLAYELQWNRPGAADGNLHIWYDPDDGDGERYLVWSRLRMDTCGDARQAYPGQVEGWTNHWTAIGRYATFTRENLTVTVKDGTP